MSEYKSKEYYKTHKDEYLIYLRDAEKKRKEEEISLNKDKLEFYEKEYQKVEEDLKKLQSEYYKENIVKLHSKISIRRQIKELKQKLVYLNNQIAIYK